MAATLACAIGMSTLVPAVSAAAPASTAATVGAAATGTVEHRRAETTPETTTDSSTQPMSSAMDAAIVARIRVDPPFRAWFMDHLRNRVRTEPAFRTWFTNMLRARIQADPTFREEWTASLRAGNDRLLANFGPQPWTGNPIESPRGGYFDDTITQWAALVLCVMAEHNIDPYYLPGILAQIFQESRGNPNAVNAWDVNAQSGYASMGLLQVIAPTYRSYARPGYEGDLVRVQVPGSGRLQQFASPWQTRPYTNLWAALNYVIGRYGHTKFASWNNGYNSGYSTDVHLGAAAAGAVAPEPATPLAPAPALTPLPTPTPTPTPTQ